MKPKYYIFTDIHGNFDSFLAALSRTDFDPENPNHTLLSLGDHFDRGPQSAEFFEFLETYRRQNRFLGILGNHDEMMLSYLQGVDNSFNIQYNGLDKTIQSFTKEYYGRGKMTSSQGFIIDLINKRHPTLKDFLKNLKDEYTIGNYHFTHGGYSYNYLAEKWEVDNWAKTSLMVKSMPKGELTEVFGHYFAGKIKQDLYGNATYADYLKPYTEDKIIALDMCTPTTGFALVATLDMNEENPTIKWDAAKIEQ